jgi:hypothetical protein
MRKHKQRIGKIIAIIPDCQVRPGVDTAHLSWIGNYLSEKQPDYIVQIGDFADMPSLNSHGKLIELEGRRYQDDVKSVHRAMESLLKPIKAVKNYYPELVLTMGNHEQRIDRVAEEQPKFLGTLSSADLQYAQSGWKVIPFLKPIKIQGIEFCHYFISGAMGRPVSSAASLLRERQCTAVQGHVQYTDLAFHKKTGNFGLFCGICYLHDEDYLTYQGNSTRRQIVMLHEVHDGTADPMFVSLEFLRHNYA